MTAKAKHSTSGTGCPSPLVLFGIDNRGKPKEARFGKEHASLAMKAATQLQLKVLPSDNPKVAEIAARLPVGRVHATCRTFALICRDLYDKLATAAPNGNGHPTSPPTGPQVRHRQRLAARRPTCPQNWQAIGLGDLVVANQSREDGWYEAILVEQNGDMFTTLARLPKGAPDRASSTSAWIALSEIPTGRRDWESSNSCAPGKARQIGCSGFRQPMDNRCPKIGTRSISIIWC